MSQSLFDLCMVEIKRQRWRALVKMPYLSWSTADRSKFKRVLTSNRHRCPPRLNCPHPTNPNESFELGLFENDADAMRAQTQLCNVLTILTEQDHAGDTVPLFLEIERLQKRNRVMAKCVAQVVEFVRQNAKQGHLAMDCPERKQLLDQFLKRIESVARIAEDKP